MIEFQYDAEGNVTRTTARGEGPSAAAREEHTFYDELNRPIRRVSAADATMGARRETCMVYDALGALVELWAGPSPTSNPSAATCVFAAPLQRQASWIVDDFGNRRRYTDGAGQSWRWDYDPHGNLATSRTPRQIAAGQSTTYAYDTTARFLLSKENASGRWEYTYNALGQLASATTKAPGGAIVVRYDYSYSKSGRLTRVLDSRNARALDYSYSPGGRLVQTSDGYGHVTQYKYDPAGRLNQIFAPNFDTLTYLHDRVGRVVEQRFGSGGSRLMEWNPDSTLKSVKTTNSAGTELTSNTFTYTGHGERAGQAGTVNGQTWSWTYQHDELGRLLLDNGPFGAGFRYDALDNRQQRITTVTEYAIHDAANRLVEIRSGGAGGPLLTVAHHDLDGQLVRLCDIRTGGTLSGSGASCTATGSGARQLELTWDAAGRLSQAVVNGTTHAYTYDHADRRLSKTVAGTTTHYAYDGDDVYARFTAGWNAPTSVTVHGGGTAEPLWELTGATNGPTAAARYYHADGLGSVVALSDVGTGALTSERRYDAWGKVLPGASGPTEYGFTGREPDETGLVYYRARYYEPTLGRFVSMDPAGMPDGVNRYAYVANDPVGSVDPTGMLASSVLAAAGISSYMPGGTMTDAPMGGFSAGAQRMPANQGQQANTWGAQNYSENDGGAVTGLQMPRVAGDRSMSASEYAGLMLTTVAIATGPAVASALIAGGRWTLASIFADARAIDPNRLHHIFGKAEHALDDFVRQSGGREQAFNRIQDAANASLRDGSLVPGPKGVLPNGNAGPIIDVGGTQIRLIGGGV